MSYQEPKVRYACMNLDRCPERWDSSVGGAEAIGVKLHRVPAVDGGLLNYDDVPEYDRKRRVRLYADLTKGEIGLNLTIRRALAEFLEGDDDFIVLMEDDIVFLESFSDVVDRCVRSWGGWDAVQLSDQSSRIYGPTFDKVGEHSLYVPLQISSYHTAIIYSRRGAELMHRSLGSFRFVSDIHLRNPELHGMGVIQVNPSVVRQDWDSFSTDVGGGYQLPRKDLNKITWAAWRIAWVFRKVANVFRMGRLRARLHRLQPIAEPSPSRKEPSDAARSSNDGHLTT